MKQGLAYNISTLNWKWDATYWKIKGKEDWESRMGETAMCDMVAHWNPFKLFQMPLEISKISCCQGLTPYLPSLIQEQQLMCFIHKIRHLFTEWLREPNPLIPSLHRHLKGCKCLEPDCSLILEPHTSR